MPYITQDDRANITMVEEEPLMLNLLRIDNAGKLNYSLTLLIREYFKRNGANYQAINDVVGALEGAKIEFYRRVAAPYEDKKIAENGDVY